MFRGTPFSFVITTHNAGFNGSFSVFYFFSELKVFIERNKNIGLFCRWILISKNKELNPVEKG